MNSDARRTSGVRAGPPDGRQAAPARALRGAQPAQMRIAGQCAFRRTATSPGKVSGVMAVQKAAALRRVRAQAGELDRIDADRKRHIALRDRAIRQAKDAGATWSEMQREAGLTAAGLRKALSRTDNDH
ncbi:MULTISPECIES: hypothetical protein [Mycolicibacterium]|uniref:Uncharacterized protein n=3 Tax=Mycolicibacterium TaxID=1866885 RepID=A0ABT6GYH8_MYCGU|nr:MULTISPECIES: hypothetical protein [Mycolicibacterium]MCV7024365.1 hypothetical protein [Mycolicibacterium novocastrense]MDG5486346.1 hypothetical protein [Mycolicibacterium gadium]